MTPFHAEVNIQAFPILAGMFGTEPPDEDVNGFGVVRRKMGTDYVSFGYLPSEIPMYLLTNRRGTPYNFQY